MNVISQQQQEESDLQELRTKLKSRTWRLNNLYWIKNKRGQKVKFRLNQFQSILFNTFWYFNIVLKARQLGITTFFCILYLDAILFSANKTAAIIAHTEKDAKKIFKEKIRFPVENLPPAIRDELLISTDSVEELSFKNGSSISVSVSTRSAAVQYLHISEFGTICQKFPEKAEEIVSGAINSVEQGQYVSIESTAKGRSGYFFNFTEEAKKNMLQGKKLNPLEFKFFFFAWWEEPTYTMATQEVLYPELATYFDELDAVGIKLTDGQKQWYQAKWKTQKDSMRVEYPSTPEEAFMASTEGGYYTNQIAQVYKEKRIRHVPFEPRVPVDTWWDLGRNDYNVIIFTQTVGREIHIIDLYFNRLEALPHYVAVMQKKRDELGYIYGSHYLPHDVEVTELSSGITRKQTLQSLGLTQIRVVPKLGIQEGIEMTRNLFNKFWFDEEKTIKLVEAIVNYRKEWDDKLGQFKDIPLHDESSHFCDALRSMGVMIRDVGTPMIDPAENDFDRFNLFPSVG